MKEIYCPYGRHYEIPEKFHKAAKNKRTGRQTYCIECSHKRRRDNYIKIVNQSLRRNYGITYLKYTDMYISQGGCCKICKEFREAIGNYPGMLATEVLNVDHCHENNKVRGLLCSRCNFALGQFDDDIEKLQHAISYLKNVV